MCILKRGRKAMWEWETIGSDTNVMVVESQATMWDQILNFRNRKEREKRRNSEEDKNTVLFHMQCWFTLSLYTNVTNKLPFNNSYQKHVFSTIILQQKRRKGLTNNNIINTCDTEKSIWIRNFWPYSLRCHGCDGGNPINPMSIPKFKKKKKKG